MHTRHIPDATSEGFYTDIDDMLEKEKGLEAAIHWLQAAAESGETLRFTPEQLAV
ncbi:MAG: hypothetical protein ACO3JG_02745 [Luteolibacter sp.]